MKKTFRKAIAVLLAVLMVAFSVPFTALAEADSVGWWGDNNWDSSKNPELLALCQEREDGTYAFDDYEGWNSPTWDYGFALGDSLSPETDLSQGADALNMVKNQYKPTLTISVWDQGTAANRIYRKFYGYGTSAADAITYDTAVAGGYKLNPAQLKAGQRIMVTFEIGGFDMIYGGQIKGIADTDYLAGAFYKLNPSSKDQWTKSTTDAMDLKVGQQRGYSYYGTALSDGTGPDYKRASGQILIPYGGNAAPPASSYVGADARGFGEHGLYIGAFSFEVLQDCNLADVLHMNQDADNNEARGVTVFTPYAPEEVNETAKFTFQTTAESYHETAGLIALNWDGYEAGGSTECTHSNVTATPAKDATCTEAGNSAYWTCNDCSKMFSDEACTTEITEVPTIPATGHSLEETAGKDATCTEAGNSAYWTCSVCGKMFADANGATEIAEIPTISATGHSLSEVKEVPSTCTVKGTAAYWTCTACGKMFSDAAGTAEISAPVELPLADHNYNMVKTDATCTEASSEVYTCSVCGDTYTTHVDPAKGHTPVSADNAVAATCTTAGKEADTVCSVCGVTLATGATIPATGHAYGDWTSNGDGTHSKVCINAGDDTKTEDCSYSYSVTKAPTIDETGIGTYTCTKCHYSYDIVLDKVTCTHTNATKTEEVPATCTEEGTEAYWTCNDCGKMFSDEACTIEIASPVVIAPKGHTEVSANNAVAATCTTAGKESDTVCSVCGVTLKEGAVIPATGHTEVEIPAVDATCTEAGSTAGTKCSVCGEIIVAPTPVKALGHTPVSADNAVAPTLDAPGKEADTVCSVCGATLEEGAVIPALEGVNITVEATDLGTTAINGEDATNGATVKVLKNSKVALTAAPVEGAEFVGWALNGKIVSESANTTVTALADATYTAVFTETAAAAFTVVFVDNYGNVISTQTVADASEIVAPTAPTRPGYTFKGWSVDYTTLTTGATIYAQFEKDAAATYTVTATGCTITTAAGDTATDVMTDVAYDTSVTITANSGTATSWKIGDSTVAFGESYTFYVGSDVTVVPQFDSAVTAKPTVTAVNVSDVVQNGKTRAVFLATRSMTDDCTYIGSGYIYGKAADVTADTTLADVNGTSIRRLDNKTASEQFSVICGIGSQTGSLAAKAYLAYVDGNGDTQVIYADLQTYTYA